MPRKIDPKNLKKYQDVHRDVLLGSEIKRACIKHDCSEGGYRGWKAKFQEEDLAWIPEEKKYPAIEEELGHIELPRGL